MSIPGTRHICNSMCDGNLHAEMITDSRKDVTEAQITCELIQSIALGYMAGKRLVSVKQVYEYPRTAMSTHCGGFDSGIHDAVLFSIGSAFRVIIEL